MAVVLSLASSLKKKLTKERAGKTDHQHSVDQTLIYLMIYIMGIIHDYFTPFVEFLQSFPSHRILLVVY